MRFFTTEGPVRPDDHYTLPPLYRWDLDEILSLIDQKKYFLLHAPRQTGKTSCLLALMEHLNREGRYRAVYANLEGAQAWHERAPTPWRPSSPISRPPPRSGPATRRVPAMHGRCCQPQRPVRR